MNLKCYYIFYHYVEEIYTFNTKTDFQIIKYISDIILKKVKKLNFFIPHMFDLLH